MEFWIKGNTLFTWLSSSRTQEKVVARGVVDGDWNPRTGEWLVVRENGRVEALTESLNTVTTTFSRDGVRARWNGTGAQITGSDGRTRIYDSRGFLERTL